MMDDDCDDGYRNVERLLEDGWIDADDAGELAEIKRVLGV